MMLSSLQTSRCTTRYLHLWDPVVSIWGGFCLDQGWYVFFMLFVIHFLRCCLDIALFSEKGPCSGFYHVNCRVEIFFFFPYLSLHPLPFLFLLWLLFLIPWSTPLWFFFLKASTGTDTFEVIGLELDGIGWDSLDWHLGELGLERIGDDTFLYSCFVMIGVRYSWIGQRENWTSTRFWNCDLYLTCDLGMCPTRKCCIHSLYNQTNKQHDPRDSWCINTRTMSVTLQLGGR